MYYREYYYFINNSFFFFCLHLLFAPVDIIRIFHNTYVCPRRRSFSKDAIAEARKGREKERERNKGKAKVAGCGFFRLLNIKQKTDI